MLPYFKRAEDNERGEDEFHGVGGPLAVSESRSMQPLVDAMLEAAVQAGYERIPDLNVDRPEGVSRFQVTQRNGKRCSTADAYLHPVADRPNLEVRTSVFAQRIVFEGNRAVGVEVVQDGKVETIRAEREVIVVRRHLPVARPADAFGHRPRGGPLAARDPGAREPAGRRNLQDHCMVNVNFTTDQPALFGILTPENFELLEKEGRGPLSSNIPEAGGFFRSRDDLPAPDLEFHFAPSIFFDEGLNAPTDPGYAFGPVLIKPNARGWVKLRTPMPDSKPLVLTNFLTDGDDRRAAIAGVRIALDIASQPALKAVAKAPYSVPESDSDADIVAWIERNAQPVYHPTSTCAIGSVVNPDLRVLGFEGLRVCDASVMPTITRANTHAATVMIAEKGADLIAGKAPIAAAQPVAAES